MKEYLKMFFMFLTTCFFILKIISCQTPSEEDGKSGDDNSGTGNETVPTTPPRAPSDLQIDTTTFCRISLSWTDNASNESSFVIERATDPGFTNITTIYVPSNSEQYNDRIYPPIPNTITGLKPLILQENPQIRIRKILQRLHRH